jgi:uncharacterized membrane protein
MSEQELSRLETIIGRLLRGGVIGSAVLLGAGLIADAAAHTVAGDRLLRAGLIVLMTIPATRIVASFVDAIQRRDHLLAWATAFVLLVMALTVALSLAAAA